jgi:hypothetical protein
MRFNVIYPDGRSETLLYVPKYNFEWQTMYKAKTPCRYSEGLAHHDHRTVDNSANNLTIPILRSQSGGASLRLRK